MWGPEGLTEAEAGVLGDVAGRDVLEVGSGAGQCSRWVRSPRRSRRTGSTSRIRQLQHSRRIDVDTGVAVPSVLGTATELPFADDSFDVVFSSFGALQFVSDIDDAVAETARVLRPGGRYAFSITHPTRWMFPDDPGEEGLIASQSYWDRTPYVEVDDETGVVSYVEHHRTLGDWVRLLAGHGFVHHRPARAGVAGGPRPGLGRLVAACAAGSPRAPRSSAPGCSSGPRRLSRAVRRWRAPPVGAPAVWPSFEPTAEP